ncbi:MAG: bifunctional diaminohydroxyphosphoribosylaminopyrimidine deaminase/5-amino-6-(5-phosphoribosylamino)uracil reductase RibD [Bacteroidales bacterium]|nr:bifunctional diaminohydroxyphosphoribosylaminopyrimidine deaminase/5-amino-6-(5-phosphoribosylamino)uracil reductase RibD [Bacteroidales bacterium]
MNSNPLHKKYMIRCLELARLGLGHTAPNPMVGSVIVAGDEIIGEGYHAKAGKPHAEVNAIQSVKNIDLLRKSTLYVNLEPCAHTGKTPPCTELIINHGIPAVIIGTSDPHNIVAGKGIKRLNQAGIYTETGICRTECINLNKRFFTSQILKRPYIILKWAQSADGFLDVIREKVEIPQPNWISNEISRKLVHKWRTEEQAVMVGTNTALLDNPRLNVREWPGKSPLRIVLDRSLRLPPSLNLFNNQHTTLVINESKDGRSGNCIYKKIPFTADLLSQVMKILHELDIQSVVIEGGKQLLDSFIKSCLWDEARIFTGSKLFKNGIKAPQIEGRKKVQTWIENDLLTVVFNENRLDSFIL